MITDEVRTLVSTIWSYSACRDPLEQADCLMVLCSHDRRVATYAAELFLQRWAPYLVFTGGRSELTARIYDKAEAEVFADIAEAAGVPRDRVITETESTNTGQNFEFTRRLLAQRALHFESFIFIQKPNMLRRVRATAMKLWPDKRFVTTSPDRTFEASVHEHVSEQHLVHEVVGDLQRIVLYAEKGFQVKQDIPRDVWAAYERLVELGYTKSLAR
jgi:uncharacterized SAM-binding protein YcdF (DUF218 family)